MTVYWDPKSKGYRYDFQHRGRRHTSPRGFPLKSEAQEAEAHRRRDLRRQAAGLDPIYAAESPTFHAWANTYLDFLEKRQRVRDIASIEHVLRVVLRFWGRKPARDLKPHERGPYHDLRLSDPIVDPARITKFEDWMLARGVAPATKNRYRTALSRLYTVAMLPEFRLATGVTMNPFRAVLRDREQGRTVTLTVPQIRAILHEASPHLRLAIAIAALAPKLRIGAILALTWADVDLEGRVIVVAEHKTVGHTGRPLVTPISDQLHAILQVAHSRSRRGARHVIEYRQARIKTIDTGLKAACEAAGVPYGLRVHGATFHTIRHTMASLLARLGVGERLRMESMGHTSVATTQRYTHLVPVDQIEPLRQLSEAVRIDDLLVGPVVRIRRKPAVPKGA